MAPGSEQPDRQPTPAPVITVAPADPKAPAPTTEVMPTAADARSLAAREAAAPLAAAQPVEEEKGADEKTREEKKKKRERDQIPEGPFKEVYVWAEENYGVDPASRNTMKAFLPILAFLAKLYGSYKGLTTNEFYTGLDSNEALSKEKFSSEDTAKLTALTITPTPWQDGDAEKLVDLEKLKSLEAEAACTSFACSLLGVESIERSQSLASRLLHTEKDGHLYYRSVDMVTLSKLKGREKFPRKSVLFLSIVGKDLSNVIIPAYATGRGKEFVYLDPKTKKSTYMTLDAASMMKVKAFFIPQFSSADPDYFNKYPEDVDGIVDESPTGVIAKDIGKFEYYMETGNKDVGVSPLTMNNVASFMACAKSAKTDGLDKILSGPSLEQVKSTPYFKKKIQELLVSYLKFIDDAKKALDEYVKSLPALDKKSKAKVVAADKKLREDAAAWSKELEELKKYAEGKQVEFPPSQQAKA